MKALGEESNKVQRARLRLLCHAAGLTLIEILVVITIIAILVAIIFPTIASTRQAANKVSAIKQVGQLGMAATLYSGDFDTYMVPSTNYGLDEDDPGRLWSVQLFTYAGNSKGPFIATGSNGQYPGSWKLRGWGSFGMNSATSIDSLYGCTEDMDDKGGCESFTDGAVIDKTLNPSAVPLFTTTPAGDTDQSYRGYEFNPYNGLPRVDDVTQSPPLVSDRDLVPEFPVLDGDLIKAVYARYNATGKDEGFAPILFADNHVKVFSAKAIRQGSTGIFWRFR
jgi:prepilin-type N-terminal cleavage/methylation domain-containing protein